MKKSGLLITIVLIAFLSSCKKEAPKDYAKLSGIIKNTDAKEVVIKGREGYSKTITLNNDGTFSDTLHLKNEGAVFLLSVKKATRIFLKNGDDLKVNIDVENFTESINFSGKGAETNNYLAQKLMMQNKINIKDLFKMDAEKFNTKSAEIITEFSNLLENNKDIDISFYKEEEKALANLPGMLEKQYGQIQSKTNGISLLKGNPSPKFKDYENYKGGKTSLDNLKGKYVYIDVWATWCRPCLGEIPHLQKLEEEFKNKKIHFVSISIDKESAKSKWKKMISDKKMGGIQLFATQNDPFIKAYKINSIPRFILIDPKGNVVNENMSRPSNPKTKELLIKLLK